jgi:DNA-directed RNA polymerase specialized sigma24 family protein
VKVERNEKALLQGLACSDRKAIETIYRENYNMIQSLIVNNNGSADDARDIFQEAMIVLYEKVRSGSFELNCLIKTYVYSVSRRLWLKRLQQMNHYSPWLITSEETIPVEEEIERNERINYEFQAMDRAISSLG